MKAIPSMRVECGNEKCLRAIWLMAPFPFICIAKPTLFCSNECLTAYNKSLDAFHEVQAYFEQDLDRVETEADLEKEVL